MKIKLDENLPESLIDTLQKFGHDVHSVRDEQLSGALDTAVWQAAQAEQRVLITQDLDFSDIRRFQPGTHAGLLLVRLHQPGRRALHERIRIIFERENVIDWRGNFVVITDNKIRIRTTK